MKAAGRGEEGGTATLGPTVLRGLPGYGGGGWSRLGERRRARGLGVQGGGWEGQGPGRGNWHRSGHPEPASFKDRATCRSNTAPWCKRRATADQRTPARTVSRGRSPPGLHILQDSLRRPSWTSRLELYTLPGKSLSLPFPHPTDFLSMEDVREVMSALGKEHFM